MFWNKKETKDAKRKNTIERETVDVNIGITYVDIETTEDLIITIAIYGYADQYMRRGNDQNQISRYERLEEPSAYLVNICDSHQCAINFIKNINRGQLTTILDDPKNPEKSYSVYIKSAQIKETEGYIEPFQKAIIVPIKE